MPILRSSKLRVVLCVIEHICYVEHRLINMVVVILKENKQQKKLCAVLFFFYDHLSCVGVVSC